MRKIDVSSKPETLRSAKGYGRIRLKRETIEAIKKGKVPKGDVLSACKLAGIMASKKTPELLPFCHPVSFDYVEIELRVGEDFIEVFSHVKGLGRTGYEMEALTSVSASLLTIYDMCKGMDDSMVIEEIRLIEKRGGKSQWSKSLEGVKIKVLSECGMKEFIEGKLTNLGAVVVEDDYQVLVSTQRLELSEIWGISYAINQKLFSLLPQVLREGVKVGIFEDKPCIEIQPNREVIETFLENFGGLIGSWINGKII